MAPPQSVIKMRRIAYRAVLRDPCNQNTGGGAPERCRVLALAARMGSQAPARHALGNMRISQEYRDRSTQAIFMRAKKSTRNFF